MKDEQMCTVLNDYFLSVFTKEDVENVPIPQRIFHGIENDQLFDIVITKDMVQQKLEELNCNKSHGPDEIHPRLLKEFSSVIAEPLAKLFQNSLVQGVVPNDSREANITALFKKGSKIANQNYRPVSLTSVICKQMESIIKDEIIKHFNIFKLINGSQHGFTKGRSCLTNLLEFFEKGTNEIDKGKPFDYIYLDFAKAFDKVPHFHLYFFTSCIVS